MVLLRMLIWLFLAENNHRPSTCTIIYMEYRRKREPSRHKYRDNQSIEISYYSKKYRLFNYRNDRELPVGICVVLIAGNLAFSHFAINSDPGSSLTMCPRTTSDNCLPAARASRTYSAVSHSDTSPHTKTSGCVLLILCI